MFSVTIKKGIYQIGGARRSRRSWDSRSRRDSQRRPFSLPYPPTLADLALRIGPVSGSFVRSVHSATRYERRRRDSNPRITDLQSVPLVRLGTPPIHLTADKRERARRKSRLPFDWALHRAIPHARSTASYHLSTQLSRPSPPRFQGRTGGIRSQRIPPRSGRRVSAIPPIIPDAGRIHKAPSTGS